MPRLNVKQTGSCIAPNQCIHVAGVGGGLAERRAAPEDLGAEWGVARRINGPSATQRMLQQALGVGEEALGHLEMLGVLLSDRVDALLLKLQDPRIGIGHEDWTVLLPDYID